MIQSVTLACLFCSNLGGRDISERAFIHWQSGKIRNEMELEDLEKIVYSASFHIPGKFGTLTSIEKNLVPPFVRAAYLC